MEADERTSDLLASAVNPPPPPPAPPPQRSASKEGRTSVSSSSQLNRERNENLRRTKSQERSWRRRPDDEVPQVRQSYARSSTQRAELGNTEHAKTPHSQGVEVSAAGRATSPDIEQSSTTSGGTSWSLRMPWLKQNNEAARYDVEQTHDLGSPLSFGESDTTYYRDVMHAYDFMNMHEIVENEPVNGTVGEGQDALSGMSSGSDGMMSSSSNIGLSRISVEGSSADSVADFKDAEWTPPDSSYGAACPMCGYVPKKTRRAAEFTMIGLVIFSLVYLVVTTSIRITNDHTTHSGSNEADVDLDDDFYVEWNANDDGGFEDDDMYAEINEEEEDADIDEEEEDVDDDVRFLRRQRFRVQDFWQADPWV